MKTIYFDIDGTLADCSHRVHHVTPPNRNWGKFFEGIPDDKPIEQVVWLNKLLSKTCSIVLCSGRSENERVETVQWLKKHGVVWDNLYMRPAGDFRPDYIVKLELIEQIKKDGYDIFFAIDDRQSVVDATRKAGIFVLQCDPKANDTRHDFYQFSKHIEFPLTLMIGPAGSGKSTWVHHNEPKTCVIASDQIRADLCNGDFKDQSRNQDVFRILHELAKTRLERGMPVVIDATNLRDADRKACVALVPDHIPIRYVVVERPIADVVASGGWRNSVEIKGQTLIERHFEVFKANRKAIMNGDGFPNVTVEVV